MTNRLTKLMMIGALVLVASPAAAQPVSNRCVTPQFWCTLPGFGPVGSPCYCNTPYGPVPGIIR
jgi:hypothetical protein